MKELKKFIIFIASIGFIAIMIAIYFLFINDESQVPKNVQERDNVYIKEYGNRKVFAIDSAEKNENNKYILYFHGGAYMGGLENYHWNFIEKLSKETGYGIIIPDYPLAPKYTYKDVFEMIEPLYTDIIKEIQPQNLIMMGDSAGGGLALALEEKLGEENIEVPEKLILISPWLDTRTTNPKIDEIQPNDKDLNKEKLKIAGIAYAGEKDCNSYLVNPIEGPKTKLKNVTIYTGTYDILNPDTKEFAEQAKTENVNITVKEYEKASHIWILRSEDELATSAYKSLIEDLKNNTVE